MISATASQVPIIGKGAVESALRARHHKPIMFADLAVPRDLEPEIQQLPDVFVYHLDQFGAMAQEGQEQRRLAALQGERIVEEHAQKFLQWMDTRGAVGTIRDLRQDAERIREEEEQAALARLSGGADAAQVVEMLSRRLTGRLMHRPTQWMRDNAPNATTGDLPEPTGDDPRHPKETD